MSDREFLAGMGDVSSEYPRVLAVAPNRVLFWMGEGNEISAPAAVQPGEWHQLSAAFDGERVRLYGDGLLVATGALALGPASPVLQIGPPEILPIASQHFGGQIAAFTVMRSALNNTEDRHLHDVAPPFDSLSYEDGSKPWPLQTRGQAGYEAPQDPATVPVSRSPFSKPTVLKRPPIGPSLVSDGRSQWTFSDGWTLKEAPKVNAAPDALSAPDFHDTGWMRATVPGTVLTTMVEDVIYPDPAYGLNNVAIPEALNKQDYWYRNSFELPSGLTSALKGKKGQHLWLTFAGINYNAEIWLNGRLLGTMKGAFRRGTFDATVLIHTGQTNALAVRIAPPPHPGIPHDHSVLGGPGDNGGAMELDGPTLLATEGWDWIPAVRDRDSGIWQPVTLRLTGDLRLGDVQVLSAFQRHDFSEADITIRVPVVNLSDSYQEAIVTASFDNVSVKEHVRVAPGETTVELTPAEFSELKVAHLGFGGRTGTGSRSSIRFM